MIRLAARICASTPRHLIHPNRMKWIESEGQESLCESIVASIRDSVMRSTVVVADNVASYYALHDRDVWDIKEDFPSVRLPVSPVFVEWSEPAEYRIGGKLVPAIPGCIGAVLENAPLDQWLPVALKTGLSTGYRGRPLTDACECIGVSTFCLRNGGAFATLDSMYLFVDDKFRVIGNLIKSVAAGSSPSELRHVAVLLHVPLLTVSFMNCKNVCINDTSDVHSPKRKWLKRNNAPFIRYHVLDINPMKEVLRQEGDIESNGLKKALHICRGHFATYTEDKPLFGRVTGTFWKPSHVRGSVEHGIVDKDYRVKAPGAPR